MTQHVRTSYRKHRRAAWGLALLAAAAVALVMFVAMAGAANVSSDKGVTPTTIDLGGQANDCSSSQVNSVADWDFRVVNPINGTTYTDTRTGASFRITLDASQITLGFVGTKAAVYDLVVKGGQKSNWYDYDATNGPGPVTNDGTLHAPPKGNTYFPVSHVSFCYSTKGSISGTVYNDLDSNGALKTSSPAEPGLAGWTVKAYNSSGTAVATSGPTGSNGSYTLSNLELGSTYAICATPSSGLWALTEPTSTPSACSTSPGGRGWSVELLASATKNFGAQSGVIPTCNTPFSGQAFGSAAGNVEYSAQLVPQGTECKDGFVVMYSYLPNTNELFATLHPPAENLNDPWEVVEHIHWEGITLDTQNPITLWYDDSFPYDGNPHTNLVPCNLDPRDGPNDFELPASHGDLTPGTETSCMLSSTDSAGSGPDDRSYDAWIYSNVDGTRGH